LRFEDRGAITEPRRGHCQHAAKLSATDDPDGRARRERLGHASSTGPSATEFVRAVRQAFSRGEFRIGQRQHLRCQQPGIDGACLADGQRANRNAAGIWTMERSES
jgi:hypothetical protein